ncbi:MAG: Smr/MutS family protein, partial [Bacteroidales bacterium]|nr:Smr/MutS family protein [Bacteroidales bacterium]
EYVESLSMSSDREALEHELILTDELRMILSFEDNFPQDNYLDVTPSLRKLEHSGTFLEVSELSELRKSAYTLRLLERYFHEDKVRQKYPVICREFEQMKVFPFVTDLIDRILTKEGTVKDNASPALKQLRDHKKQKQTAVSRKLQSILKSARQDGLTDADAEVTLRDGRPVIPVLSGMKRKISGLVHDESSSGKTVFIEPTEVVELNNEIREIEYAERREILNILSGVAEELRPYRVELLEVYAQLGKIDFLRAKARLAIRLNGVKPIMSADDSMQWKHAVHPLLYLAHHAEGKEVVPLDIKMDAESRILLISGPNAGGKSVCLKTVGLLQYMLQCGLLIPMKENSEVRVFTQIFIDIGDEQSLENDLSTYSSHLLNMKHFIRHADSGTLVLIDEFGTGTEPALGGAIAEAILESLNKQQVYGVITTHYANLKHFASEAEGIVNGAMLFDTDKIQPLFSLSIGEPGSSFAIEIARKIGLSEEILSVASERVGSDYINFEKHLREIIRDKHYWEEKRKKIRRVEKTLDGLYLNYSDELQDIQKERKHILRQAKEEAKALLRDANRQVEKTIREIRESDAEKSRTRTAREGLEEYKHALDKDGADADKYDKKLQELHEAGKKLIKHSPEMKQSSLSKRKVKEEKDLDFEVGDSVKMAGMDTHGEVMEVHGKNILVAFGDMISSLSRDKLIKVEGESKKSGRSSAKSNVQDRKLNFRSEIDVRGQRGDEALALVQAFIDDALMVSVRHLRILHGKGNGILRQLIRDYLQSTGIVKSIKDAHADQGGAGITFVELDI